MIEFGPAICGNLDAALSREWLDTNGIGGFASSTIIGANTRRYHGLLTAALQPPVGRTLLLSKLEETVFVDSESFELGVNIYSGATHPEGYSFLTCFRLDPFPVFTYEAAGAVLEKRVFLVHRENTTVIEYENVGDTPCELELRPLLAFRDYHSTTRANAAFNPELTGTADQISIQPYATMPRLYFAHNAPFGRERRALVLQLRVPCGTRTRTGFRRRPLSALRHAIRASAGCEGRGHRIH